MFRVQAGGRTEDQREGWGPVGPMASQKEAAAMPGDGGSQWLGGLARLSPILMAPSSSGSSCLMLRLWSHLAVPTSLLRDPFLINFCDRTKSACIINTQLDEPPESWSKVGILAPEGVWSPSLLLCPRKHSLVGGWGASHESDVWHARCM